VTRCWSQFRFIHPRPKPFEAPTTRSDPGQNAPAPPRTPVRTFGKRVGGNPSLVRISYPPPVPHRPGRRGSQGERWGPSTWAGSVVLLFVQVPSPASSPDETRRLLGHSFIASSSTASPRVAWKQEEDGVRIVALGSSQGARPEDNRRSRRPCRSRNSIEVAKPARETTVPGGLTQTPWSQFWSRNRDSWLLSSLPAAGPYGTGVAVRSGVPAARCPPPADRVAEPAVSGTGAEEPRRAGECGATFSGLVCAARMGGSAEAMTESAGDGSSDGLACAGSGS
jgi:hypothetical protein